MLPVVSVVPGVRSGVLLGWLPGYDCRPDDSPPGPEPARLAHACPDLREFDEAARGWHHLVGSGAQTML